MCKVPGRNITGDVGKSFRDKRSRITMRKFVAQKGRMKRTNLDLVDWKAVDKIMDNSTQQFCLWVNKHISTFS